MGPAESGSLGAARTGGEACVSDISATFDVSCAGQRSAATSSSAAILAVSCETTGVNFGSPVTA